MKKCGLLLLITLFLTYGYQGYKIVHIYMNDEIKVKTSGKLSDIAKNVFPVPLETPDSGIVRNIKRVQQDGDNIFLLSDKRLLHFNLSGKFISQPAMEISNNNEVYIADYTLDTDNHRVIVIDSQRKISKYDYSGNLISRAKINQQWRRISAFTYHNGYLWISAETTEKITDISTNNNYYEVDGCTTGSPDKKSGDNYQVIHRLYQLDCDMNEISNQKLYLADIGRDIKYNSPCIDELLVDDDGIYAYSSPVDMQYIFSDTMHILQYNIIPSFALVNRHQGETGIYPVRKGNRFMMSTNHNIVDNCYTFCFDKTKYIAYMLSEGFNDDFYNTGNITDLQPLDIHNTTYCFLKSEANIPILFIVTLNS